SSVAGGDRSARLPGGRIQRAGRRIDVFTRREVSGRRLRHKALAIVGGFSQSAEGLGGRHAPTDPPPEWTYGLLYFSRLLKRRKAAGERQPRRNGDHLVNRDLESDSAYIPRKAPGHIHCITGMAHGLSGEAVWSSLHAHQLQDLLTGRG